MNIEVRNLRFSYGSKPALSGISFSVGEGALVCVLGANGAGKSTLFQCILGLRRGYAGWIALGGSDARGLSARARARHIAYVPQLTGEAVGYTAFEVALMGTSPALAPLACPGAREARIAMDALCRLGIEDLAPRMFMQLSGGERQLALIARALAQGAQTLILDEPTAALDYGNQQRVLSLLRALARAGYAVVYSTHSPQHALTHADCVLALSGGKIAACGAPDDCMDARLIEALYGVPARIVQAGGAQVILPG
ncbi:MAG: ABC transporter ATP-binding protein [Christensenellales bacterium]